MTEKEYKIQAQRHIHTLFYKDELGGYNFSSTVTFVKRNGEYFCVFAAHALPESEQTLKNIGVLKTDGEFSPLEEVAKSYSIDRENDLVICRTKAPFEHKNYFDLDVSESSSEFIEDAIGWIGFPKKKAKQAYHKTKSSVEHVKQDLSTFEDGRVKWNNANYLLLGMEVNELSNMEISAHFDDKNVIYAKEGFKEQAYSLKGMSGGALFHGPRAINSENPILSDFFKFAGIGLEHHSSDKIIKGVPASFVVKLIDNHITSST